MPQGGWNLGCLQEGTGSPEPHSWHECGGPPRGCGGQTRREGPGWRQAGRLRDISGFSPLPCGSAAAAAAAAAENLFVLCPPSSPPLALLALTPVFPPPVPPSLLLSFQSLTSLILFFSSLPVFPSLAHTSSSSSSPARHSPVSQLTNCFRRPDKNSGGQAGSQVEPEQPGGPRALATGVRSSSQSYRAGPGGGPFGLFSLPNLCALPAACPYKSLKRPMGKQGQDVASHCFCPQPAPEGGSSQPGKTENAVTMTTSHQPQDRYKAVWLIFFMLGLGTLLPWNFFMTATQYFTNRLDESQNMSLVTAELSKDTQPSATPTAPSPERNSLSAIFNNVMTLCAMLPLLVFTCLNSFLHQRIPQSVRILGSLIAILLVFLITAILVKVQLDAVPFFIITMVKIVLINCGSELSESAFGYFITACGVIVLTIICYLVLPRLEFYRYYQQFKFEGPGEQETKLDLINKGEEPVGNKEESRVPAPNSQPTQQSHSIRAILRNILVPALSVCFIFTVTIGVFPAVTAEVQSTIAGNSAWGKYFIPVSCFLTFNVFDWLGRSLTAIFTWPGKDSHWLPSLVLARMLFVPLLLLCNVQPRRHLAVVFEHDAWFIIFMAAFAFSNGYLASLCMCFGPKKVKPAEAETAGAIMAFFLSLGLALGAVFSFLCRSIV
uniref:Heat shock protein 90 alpha family class B member 1 n=2 Tax=Canis lupus familiaris TaxID=9615 RepID=A0A8C0MVV2_CANLF